MGCVWHNNIKLTVIYVQHTLCLIIAPSTSHKGVSERIKTCLNSKENPLTVKRIHKEAPLLSCVLQREQISLSSRGKGEKLQRRNVELRLFQRNRVKTSPPASCFHTLSRLKHTLLFSFPFFSLPELLRRHAARLRRFLSSPGSNAAAFEARRNI